MNAENLLIWIIVGLIAGWLAGVVVRGGGFGVVGDIVIGIIGAFLGGLLFSSLGIGAYGIVGSIVVAFIGAVVLLLILRAVAPYRTRV